MKPWFQRGEFGHAWINLQHVKEGSQGKVFQLSADPVQKLPCVIFFIVGNKQDRAALVQNTF